MVIKIKSQVAEAVVFASVLVVLVMVIHQTMQTHLRCSITREVTSSQLRKCALESRCVHTEINLSEEKRAEDGRHV